MTKKQVTKLITRAYCVELQKELTIDQAIAESAKRGGVRFNFLCSSSECRKHNIPITGVLYHIDPMKKKTKRTPGFAINPHHGDHLADCEWVTGYSSISENVTTKNFISDDVSNNLTNPDYKKSHLIDVFIFPSIDNTGSTLEDDHLSKDEKINKPSYLSNVKRKNGNRPNLNTTKLFRRIVDQYILIKQNEPELLNKATIDVKEVGTYSWNSFFHKINHTDFDSHKGAFYGNCTLSEESNGYRYFNFYDNIKGYKSSIRVSIDDLTKILVMSNNLQEDEYDYFTVYFLSPKYKIITNKNEKKFLIIEVDPSMIVVIGNNKKT